MSCDTTDIYIDLLAVSGGILNITTLTGTGTGETLVNDGLGNDLVTKDLIAGAGITLISTADDITIAAAAIASSLQATYDASGAPPHIILSAANGPLTIQDNAVPIGGNLFQVNDSGAATTVFSVDATSVTVDGKLNVTGAIDPTALILNEQATIPIPAAAGTGTLWVQNTAPSTLVFTDDTGTDVVLGGASTFQDTYSNSTSPQVVVDAVNGAFTIQDNAVPTGGNLFQVNDSGAATTVFAVDSTSVTIDGKLNVTGLIDPTGLVLNEQATSPSVPAVGAGTLWIANTTPPSLIFTNSLGVDLNLSVELALGQTFTSNGSFIVPTGITSLNVILQGGGGGGGGGYRENSGGGGNGGSGGGGGSGDYVTLTLTVTPGETLNIVVGGGGLGGTGLSNGGNGGTSRIQRGATNLAIAEGGSGGNGGSLGTGGNGGDGYYGGGGGLGGGATQGSGGLGQFGNGENGITTTRSGNGAPFNLIFSQNNKGGLGNNYAALFGAVLLGGGGGAGSGPQGSGGGNGQVLLSPPQPPQNGRSPGAGGGGAGISYTAVPAAPSVLENTGANGAPGFVKISI